VLIKFDYIRAQQLPRVRALRPNRRRTSSGIIYASQRRCTSED